MPNPKEVSKRIKEAREEYDSLRRPFVEFLLAGTKMDAGWGAEFFTSIRSRFTWVNTGEFEDENGNRWLLIVKTDRYDPNAGDPEKAEIKARLSSAEASEGFYFVLRSGSVLSVSEMNELVEDYKDVRKFIPFFD